MNDKRYRAGRSNPPSADTADSSVVVMQDSQQVSPAGATMIDEANPVQTCSDTLQSDEMSVVLSKYQSELDQKDELITALIVELEQAVEQIDRFKRTGASNLQVELSELHSNNSKPAFDSQSLVNHDLHRMAEDWERSQPGVALERIESQLAEVHNLIRNLQQANQPDSAVDEFQERIRNLNADVEPDCQQDTVNLTLDETSPSWNAIKNQLFGDETTIEDFGTRAEDSNLLKLMRETPAPRTIDIDTAEINDLKQAVIERDAYIIQLNRLFRTRNSLSLPNDWATLAEVPGEMQIRVESLIEHLDVQVRLGEVEMSLDRARLARERSQIQGEREQIDKHLRRLGLRSISELDNISAAPGTASDRRWMRFIGPNSK